MNNNLENMGNNGDEYNLTFQDYLIILRVHLKKIIFFTLSA